MLSGDLLVCSSLEFAAIMREPIIKLAPAGILDLP